MSDADLEAVIKRAQQAPISTAIPDPSFLDNGQDDNVALSRHELIQPRWAKWDLDYVLHGIFFNIFQ